MMRSGKLYYFIILCIPCSYISFNLSFFLEDLFSFHTRKLVFSPISSMAGSFTGLLLTLFLKHCLLTFFNAGFLVTRRALEDSVFLKVTLRNSNSRFTLLFLNCAEKQWITKIDSMWLVVIRSNVLFQSLS